MKIRKQICICILVVVWWTFFGNIIFASNDVFYDDPEQALNMVKDMIDTTRYKITTKTLNINGSDSDSVVNWVSSTKLGGAVIYEIPVHEEGLITVDLNYHGQNITSDKLWMNFRVKNSFMDNVEINAHVQRTSKDVKADGKVSFIEDKFTFYGYPGTYYIEVRGWSSQYKTLPYSIEIYQDTFPEIMQGNMGNPTREGYPNILGEIDFNKEVVYVESSLNMMNYREANSKGEPGYYKINGYDEFYFTSMFSGDAVIQFENLEAQTITDYYMAYRQGGQTTAAKETVPILKLSIQPVGESKRLIKETSYGINDIIKYKVEAGTTYKVQINGNQLPAHYRFEIDYPDSGEGTHQGIVTASSWAVEEINKAISVGLTTDAMTKRNYKDFATREDFAEIVMTFYDKLGGEPVVSGENVFVDTVNKEIIRAQNSGIINGTSNTTFSPKKNLTREQLCVMILRALEAADINYNGNGKFQKSYMDYDAISSWAVDSVAIINSYKIMNGFDNKLDPQGTVTKEMAMLMLHRAYEQFK